MGQASTDTESVEDRVPSSTDTEPEQHVKVSARPGKLPGPKRGVKRKNKRSSATAPKPSASRWATFLQTFNKKLCESKSGCPFCLRNCFRSLQPLLDELKRWREEMESVGAEVADKELLWIFKPDLDTASDSEPRKPVHKDDEQDGSSTSTEQVAEASEGRTTDTSEPESSSSRNCSRQPNTSKMAQQRSRSYTSRHGSKRPSVRIDKFLRGADKGMRICQKSAVLALGIGNSRLQRASWLHRSMFV